MDHGRELVQLERDEGGAEQEGHRHRAVEHRVVPRLRADAGEAAEHGRQQQAGGLEGDCRQVEQVAAARAAGGGVGEHRVAREQRREQDDVADQEDPEAVGDDDALRRSVRRLLGERLGVAADKRTSAAGDPARVRLRPGAHESGLSVRSAASRAARLARSTLATVAAGIASSCSSRQATTTNTAQAPTKATATSHQMCQISAKPMMVEKKAQMKPAELLRGMWMS